MNPYFDIMGPLSPWHKWKQPPKREGYTWDTTQARYVKDNKACSFPQCYIPCKGCMK